MGKPLRVLSVEDDVNDFNVLVRSLSKGGFEPEAVRVDKPEAMEAALALHSWDVVVSDMRMPHFSGFDALTLLRHAGCDVPFIVVSGTIGEEKAAALMKAGANDYIHKDNLARLVPVVERELREHADRRARAKVEERYRQIVETADEGIWTTDTDGRTEFVNRRLAEMLGYAPDELVGRSLIEFVIPAEHDALAAILSRKPDGPSGPHDFRFRRKEGDEIWVLLNSSAIQDEQGQWVGALSMLTDITQRKRAEEALREREELLRAILDSSTTVIYVKDRAGKYLMVNHRFEELFHVSREAIMGQTDADHFPAARAAAFHRNDLAVVEAHRALEFEEVVEHDDGLHTYISIKAPLFDDRNEVYAVCGISTDITDRKRAEAERAELSAREQAARAEADAAKELDRLRIGFINSISHELRTPLTSILGFAEFLEDGVGGSLSPKQLEFVAEIMRSARRLDYLVNDLLDTARLGAGTFRLQTETAEFGEKVREIADSLLPQAREAGLSLEIALPGPLEIRMDPQRIGQVLINLVGNAIKFTPPGGRIRVRAAWEGRFLRCEVEDTGPGIAADDLPKLFQLFGQLAAGHLSKTGTGLGLAISKGIVEAHGGMIGARSEPGQGSTFWFTLPLTSP